MESKGDVKHLALLKFKDNVSQATIDELIKSHAKLVNVIPPLKAFQWGLDKGNNTLNHGFTHVFETIFESAEGVEEYRVHPAHVEYAQAILPHLDTYVVMNYVPTIFESLKQP